MTLRSFIFLIVPVLAFALVPHMAVAAEPFFLLTGDPLGLALVVTGLILLVAEIFILSHGLLALSGALFFLLGSVLVVQAANPTAKLLWVYVFSCGLFLFAGMTAVMMYALRTYKRSNSRKFSLSGQQALVIDWNATTQRVEVDGAFWMATSQSGNTYTHGEWVTILSQDNLTLIVE